MPVLREPARNHMSNHAVPVIKHANFRMGVSNGDSTSSVRADISIQTSDSKEEMLKTLDAFCASLKKEMVESYGQRVLASKPVIPPLAPSLSRF